MTAPPDTYDDWLALDDEERRDVHFHQWDVYQRDGIAIAFMAATRLAMQCPYKVLDIAIGTFHCGEYVLHMTVSEADFQTCPPQYELIFEGFRVVWLPAQSFAIDPVIGATIDGTWISIESSDDYEFQIRLVASGVDVQGVCRSTGQELLISYPALNGEWAVFTAYHPSTKKTTNHAFRLVEADRCEDHVLKTECYARA